MYSSHFSVLPDDWVLLLVAAIAYSKEDIFGLEVDKNRMALNKISKIDVGINNRPLRQESEEFHLVTQSHTNKHLLPSFSNLSFLCFRNNSIYSFLKVIYQL